MGQIQSLDEFISLLIRRRLLIGLILCAGIALSLLLGLSQSKTYEAGAVIQLETQVVADGSNAAAGGQSAQLLQSIEQRLTTRDNLIAMIERHGLFADAPGLSMEKKVSLLRQSIGFQSVASVAPSSFGAPAGVSALIITARFGNADQAARVANDFAQSVLDLSTAGQSERVKETLQFFVEEEARVGTEITALEAEVAAFKNRNSAALPSSRDAQREELVALEAEMRRLDQSLVASLGKRAAIEKKGQLRETDRRDIDDLSVQIEVLASQKSALEDQRDALSAIAALAPNIERELGVFERRTQQLQSQYEVITTKLAEAETTLKLEERQHSEHFTFLERAMVPEYAVGGSRKKVALAGTIASLGVAIAVAFFMDLLNPVLRTPEQMQRQLDLRPVISIPDVKPQRGGRRQTQHRLKPLLGLPRYTVIAGGAMLLLAVAAAAIA